MLSVYFNGYNSYKDLGLAIESKPVIPIPIKRIREIVIPGRSGTLVESEGTYENIVIPIVFGFSDRKTFQDKGRFIKDWLNNIADNRLILSDDKKVYYKVKYARSESVERSMWGLGRMEIEFICEPFAYLNEVQMVEATASGSIYNPATYYSEPVITVYGTGNITLTINDNQFGLLNVNGYITINAEIMEVYRDKVNCNNQFSAMDFPRFEVGENVISFTGNVQKIEIEPNWRWL